MRKQAYQQTHLEKLESPTQNRFHFARGYATELIGTVITRRNCAVLDYGRQHAIELLTSRDDIHQLKKK